MKHFPETSHGEDELHSKKTVVAYAVLVLPGEGGDCPVWALDRSFKETTPHPHPDLLIFIPLHRLHILPTLRRTTSRRSQHII
jgi:hypothetical protein